MTEGSGLRGHFPGGCGSGRNSALCLLKGLFYSPAFSFLLPTEAFFPSSSPGFHLPLQKPLVKDREAELLYFADVCAGPGGFSEYVLWRKRWHAKGFGLTLKGPHDFKLEDFYSASSELFEPYYGRDTEEAPGTERDKSYQEELLSTCRVFCPGALSLGFPAHVMRSQSHFDYAFYPRPVGSRLTLQ